MHISDPLSCHLFLGLQLPINVELISTLPQPSLTNLVSSVPQLSLTTTIAHIGSSTLPQPTLTPALPRYLSYRSHRLLHTTSTITHAGLHTTLTITHALHYLNHRSHYLDHCLSPHYLNHHSHSTLPRPSLSLNNESRGYDAPYFEICKFHVLLLM